MGFDWLKYSSLSFAVFTVIFGAFVAHNLITERIPKEQEDAKLVLKLNKHGLTEWLNSEFTLSAQTRELIRDRIQEITIAEQEHISELSNIRKYGTHDEKIAAGMTQNWYGQYDHELLKPTTTIAEVIIPKDTIFEWEKFPTNLVVILGYNDTVKFINEDHVQHWIYADHGNFTTPYIMPNQTATITINEQGFYGFFGRPYHTGNLTAYPINYNNLSD